MFFAVRRITTPYKNNQHQNDIPVLVLLYFINIIKIYQKYIKIVLTIIFSNYTIYSKNNIKRYTMSKGSETKRECFVRLAEARTNKILDMLRLLGNCSSKGNYDYTDEDVKKIFNAIEKEVKNTKNKFLGIDSKEERFTLN